MCRVRISLLHLMRAAVKFRSDVTIQIMVLPDNGTGSSRSPRSNTMYFADPARKDPLHGGRLYDPTIRIRNSRLESYVRGRAELDIDKGGSDHRPAPEKRLLTWQMLQKASRSFSSADL